MARAGDWDELGIAPTDDAAIIRRAYALRLRTTRPDDDALAYQRLREAYDRLLARARVAARAPSPPEAACAGDDANDGTGTGTNESEAATPPDGEDEVATDSARSSRQSRPPGDADDAAASPQGFRFVPPSPPSPSPPAAAPVPNFVFAPLPPPWGTAVADHLFIAPPAARPPAPAPLVPIDTAQGLADELATTLADGNALARWPELQARLDALPLAASARAAIAFADLVLAADSIPVEILIALRQHFAWTRDFRQARVLGPERARDLQLLLDAKAPEPITDREVLSQHRHLMWFSRLIAGYADVGAMLLAIGVGRPMRAVLRQADAATLRRLGIGPLAVLEERLKAAAALRALLLMLILAAIGALLGADGAGVWKGMVAAGMWWYVVVLMGRGLIGRARWLLALLLPKALQARIGGWRAKTLLPLLATLVLAAAAGLFGFAERAGWEPSTSWLCVLVAGAALLLCWPREVEHAVLSIALIVVLMVGFQDQVGDRGALTMILFLAAWCFLCAWVFERGRYRHGSRFMKTWRRGLARSPVLEPALLLPGFPYFMFSAAQSFGTDIVVASLASCPALTAMPIYPSVQNWSLLAIPLAFFALEGLQSAAIRLADSMRARAERRRAV